MDISLVIISITTLFIAWALARIISRIQGLEKHMKNLKSRIQSIEKARSSQYQTGQQVGMFKPGDDIAPQTPSGQTGKVGAKFLCPFCKFEYDSSLDRCPRCHHLNIEKIRSGRSGGSKSAPPSSNSSQGTDF